MAQLALDRITNDLILSTGLSDPTNRLLWSEKVDEPPWGRQNCDFISSRISNGKVVSKVEDSDAGTTGIFFQSPVSPVTAPTHYTFSVLIVKDAIPRSTRFVGFMSNVGTSYRTEISLDTSTGEWIVSLNAGQQAVISVEDAGDFWKVVMTEANPEGAGAHWRIIPALGSGVGWDRINTTGSVEFAEAFCVDGILNFPYTKTEAEYIPPDTIITGGVERVRGGRYTVQQVQSGLRTFSSEWLLDRSVGWLMGTDFERNFNQFEIEDRARRIILGTKGVKEILSLTATYANRKLEINFEADTVYGRIFRRVAW